MQKHFFLFFFISFSSIFCLAQESGLILKNNIGLGLLYNDRTDSKLDLRYERFLISKHLVGVSIFSNFSSTVGLKAGYKLMLYDKPKFQLLSGLDYHYESFKVVQFPNQTFKAQTIEIPLEARLKLKNELKIYIGLAAGWSLNNRKDENVFINNLKIGILKSF